MTYDPKSNTVSIDASKSEFVSQYLKYLLQHHNIPSNATVVFERDNIHGGS